MFEIFRFSVFEVYVFLETHFRQICWWDIEEQIKVSWRDPGQNGRFWGPFLVLWSVSLPKNVEKLTFRCHVRPNRLKSCMYDRMLGAVTLETSKPPQFQPELPKKHQYLTPYWTPDWWIPRSFLVVVHDCITDANWRCLLCFLTPRGVPAITKETFCNS